MKMSKNVIVLLSLGGFTLVAAGALAVMVFGAIGDRATAVEDLETVRTGVQRLSQSRVKPWAETLKLVEANAALVDGWRRLHYAKAGEGDFVPDGQLTGAAFKQRLQADMAALQTVKTKDGAAVVPTAFSQTFRTYIEEASIPSAEELVQLQRHWHDVRFLAETLASNGVVEVVKIEPITKATSKAVAQPDEATQKRQEKAKKKKAKKAGKAEPEAVGPVQIAETYQLEFKTRPAGVVNALNAFSSSKRFVTVKSFGFFRESDMIGKAIGDKNQKSAAADAKPRNRGRGRMAKLKEAAEEKTETAEKKGLVNDPDLEAPFKMSMTVEINDFGTGSGTAAEAAGDDEAGAETEAGKASESEDTEVAE